MSALRALTLAELHMDSAEKLKSKGKSGARWQIEALPLYRTHLQACIPSRDAMTLRTQSLQCKPINFLTVCKQN